MKSRQLLLSFLPCRQARIPLLSAAVLSWTVVSMQAQSVWNGIGVTGGTGNNDWNTAANWTGGVPNGPGANLTFDSTATVNIAATPANPGAVKVVNNGAAVGTISVGASTTFTSIEAPAGALTLAGTRTLTISGSGDVYKITSGNMATNLDSDTIKFTGSNLTFATTYTPATFKFGAAASNNVFYVIEISNSAASVDFNSKTLELNGRGTNNGGLRAAGGQTWTNAPQVNFNGRNLNLTNSNATPLSMPNTSLNWTNAAGGAGESFNVAGGTYAGMNFNNSAFSSTMVLQGDVTLSGTSFAGLSLSTNGSSTGATIDLNGKTLHVSNSGAAPNIDSAGSGTSTVNLNAGTLRSGNGLTVNSDGAIVGTGTVTIDDGRLVFLSTKTAATNMTAATFQLGNSADGIDWNSGSIDISVSNAAADFTAANFAVNSLSLGTGAYDLAGGGTHDLLLNGSLSIGAGGVLNLGNWSSVTLGGDAQTVGFAGLGQLGNVQSLINAGRITANGLGAGLALGTIQTGSGDAFFIGAVTAVPEPNVWSMLLVGVTLYFSLSRWRRRMVI